MELLAILVLQQELIHQQITLKLEEVIFQYLDTFMAKLLKSTYTKKYYQRRKFKETSTALKIHMVIVKEQEYA